jgi:flagellar protein FlaG
MSGMSASTLVIFIASILVAASVAGTLVTTVGDISNSAETRGDAVSDSIDTDIEILNDGGGSDFYTESGGGANVTLYARNSGTTTIPQDAERINVLVNGRLVPPSRVAITSMASDDDAGGWVEGEVLEFRIELEEPLSGSDNRVTVSVDGAERFVEFKATA